MEQKINILNLQTRKHPFNGPAPFSAGHFSRSDPSSETL